MVPDLVEFADGHGDAAIGAIARHVGADQPSHAMGQVVSHAVATGSDPALARAGYVICVGIRDVQRLIQLAVAVAPVNDVDALGGLVVSALSFATGGFAAERDFVALERFAIVHQHELAFALENDDAVGFYW